MTRDDRATSGDLRCDCGSLMARLTANQIELKCRRCKRVHLFRIVLDCAVDPPSARPCCGDVEVAVVND